jgi:hypothetical protein
LLLDETRYEELTDPGENKVTGTKIRGYQGGYGDKNPLLVMSNSGGGGGKGGGEEPEAGSKKPLSIAKMMSMRMSQSQSMRKGKSSGGGGRGSKPEHIPMTMSNSGRLMHYPRGHNSESNRNSSPGEEGRLRNERIISSRDNQET